MKKSKLGKLNFRDILNGVLLAISTVFVYGLGQSLTTGVIPSNLNDFEPIILTSLSAGVAYIGKNLSENSEGKPFKKEPVEKIE